MLVYGVGVGSIVVTLTYIVVCKHEFKDLHVRTNPNLSPN